MQLDGDADQATVGRGTSLVVLLHGASLLLLDGCALVVIACGRWRWKYSRVVLIATFPATARSCTLDFSQFPIDVDACHLDRDAYGEMVEVVASLDSCCSEVKSDLFTVAHSTLVFVTAVEMPPKTGRSRLGADRCYVPC